MTQAKLHKVRYWKVTVGEDADQWAAWRLGNFVAMGWDELGDLTTQTRGEFEAQRDALTRQFPERTKSAANQVWRYARQISEGDRVVVKRNAREILAIGTVTGGYYFVPDAHKGHCFPVEWDDLTRRAIHEPGWRKSLVEVDAAHFAALVHAPIIEPSRGDPIPPAMDQPLSAPKRLSEERVLYQVHSPGRTDLTNSITDALPTGGSSPARPYSIGECAVNIGVDEATVQRWLAALERKGQVIFYGPPGVGKTYIAQELARLLTSNAPDDGCWELVQFHPSYAYEDFVQGLRPRPTASGGLEYALIPGRLLDFCRKVVRRQGTCVLIIDEINRANLAHVFGEVMTLLEYRGQSVALAAGGPPFALPTNLRIIGTMNSADRSIALVDHALRRRFAMIELSPNYALLEHYHAQHKPTGQLSSAPSIARLIRLLQRINQRIDNRHYALGISFFLRPQLAAELADIWQMEIEPYLEEYFFDQPETVAEFRWEQVRAELS